MRLKILQCNCCGKNTKGRQWWNRDTGFGLCRSCFDWKLERGQTKEQIEQEAGKENYHCAID